MGLIAGMSLISVIEMVLRIMMTVVQAFRKLRKRNKTWAYRSSEQVSNESPNEVNAAKWKILTFITNFIENSSIHGLQEISIRGQHIAEKLFWAVTVSASTGFCLITIFDITKHSELNPIEYGSDDKIWSLSDVSW